MIHLLPESERFFTAAGEEITSSENIQYLALCSLLSVFG